MFIHMVTFNFMCYVRKVARVVLGTWYYRRHHLKKKSHAFFFGGVCNSMKLYMLIFLPDVPWAGMSIFLAFRLKLKHQLFLGFRPLDSDWNYTIVSLPFPARQLRNLELVSLCDHVSQFLMINLSLSQTLSLFVLFLWRTLTNTGLLQTKLL